MLYHSASPPKRKERRCALDVSRRSRRCRFCPPRLRPRWLPTWTPARSRASRRSSSRAPCATSPRSRGAGGIFTEVRPAGWPPGRSRSESLRDSGVRRRRRSAVVRNPCEGGTAHRHPALPGQDRDRACERTGVRRAGARQAFVNALLRSARSPRTSFRNPARTSGTG